MGAKELPRAEVLSREIIQINRGVGSLPSAPGTLEYELRPDDSLSITHTKVDKNLKRVMVGREILHLSRDAAAQARRMLWRVRPESLQGIETETRPIGCPPPPVDSPPEFFVDFISEGPKRGIADDKVGVVFVPNTADCRNAQATETRRLLQDVLQSFPASKVADDFDKEVSAWKARLAS